MGPSDSNEFVRGLEARLEVRSDELEKLHLEAAIDAQLIATEGGNPIVAGTTAKTGEVIFDDYTNSNAVANCLSPYVPSSAESIEAFCRWVQLTSSDVLLDIGCGDGRVCVSASKISGCKSVGLDVSPLCIVTANEVAREEGLENLCQFYEADATIDPDLLLSDSSPIASLLESVTVIFLYTYPTLLKKVVPLLKRLCPQEALRAVVTLRYHIPDGVVDREDKENEFQLYTRMSRSWLSDAVRACAVTTDPDDEIEMEC